MSTGLRILAMSAFVILAASSSFAQEFRSTALAKELTQLLQTQKLTSVAAKDPAGPDRFVAALFLPGQLLIIAAQYTVPVLLNERLYQHNYMDVYQELQAASVPGSRMFVDDLGADGLQPKPKPNQPYDSVEATGTRTAFDGAWKKRKMSEQDYMSAFGTADTKYAQILSLLLAELKKPS